MPGGQDYAAKQAQRVREAFRVAVRDGLAAKYPDHSICGACECRVRPRIHPRSDACHVAREAH